jgi:heme-degrading monooxygenase HmoA
MASMIVQHKVNDFAAWKKVYEANKPLRTSNGELADQIFRDADDPNKLIVVFKWDSLANAQKFAHSPELRAAMEKAGVVGVPAISFHNEA